MRITTRFVRTTTIAISACLAGPILACGWGFFGWGGWGRLGWYLSELPETGVTSSHTAGMETNATVRFEQPSIFDRRTGAGWASQVFSDTGSGWQTFDNFQFSEAEYLTALRWEGFFYNENLGDDENTHHWEVQIWTDRNGAPGKKIMVETYYNTTLSDFEEEDVESVGPSNTVRNAYGSDRYLGPNRRVSSQNYEVELNVPFFAKAGKTYWISISAVSATPNPVFVWVAGNGCGCDLPPLSFAALPPSDGCYQLDHKTSELVWREGDRALTLVGAPAEDADHDGMRDSWELAHGLDPDAHDAEGDLDGDGASNLWEFAMKCDPQNPDSDSDGLSDGIETNRGWFNHSADTGTHPMKRDTDGDGLPDGREIYWDYDYDSSEHGSTLPTDPTDADSDDDGLLDGYEAYRLAPTEPNGPEPVPADAVTALHTGGDLTDGNGVTIRTSATRLGPDFGLGAPVSGESGAASLATVATEISASEATALNVFDNDPASSWSCDENCRFPLWVEAKFPEPRTLTAFALMMSATEGALPTVWEIQGSRDGVTFTTIFQNTSFWAPPAHKRHYTAGQHYQEPRAYSTIRFVVYEAGWAGFELAELEFFSQPAPIRDLAVRVHRHTETGAMQARLQWHAEAGTSCVIERSADLKNWITLPGTHTGRGQFMNFVDRSLPNPAPRGMFYRVRALE